MSKGVRATSVRPPERADDERDVSEGPRPGPVALIGAAEPQPVTPSAPTGLERDFFRLVSSNLGVLALSLVASIVINRGLSLEQRGDYALVSTVAALVVLATGLGLSNALTYVTVSASEPTRVAALITSVGLALGALASVTLIVRLLFFPHLDQVYRDYYWYIPVLAGMEILYSFNRSYVLARGDYKSYAQVNVVLRVVYVVILLLVSWLRHLDMAQVLLSQLAGQGLLTVVLYARVPFASANWSGLDLRRLLGVGIRGFSASFLGTTIKRSDVFFVQSFLGPQVLGLYSVASLLYGLGDNIVGAAGLLIANRAAAGAADLRRVVRTASVRLTLLIAAGLVVFALIGKPLLVLLYTGRFAGVYPILLMLGPALLVSTFFSPYANAQAGKGYSINYVLIHVLALVLGILSLRFLTPWLGVAGAALANLVINLTLGYGLYRQFQAESVH
ncbi:MAG: oligosaccharide flippase family protein [Gemmatimonadota bacterium]